MKSSDFGGDVGGGSGGDSDIRAPQSGRDALVSSSTHALQRSTRMHGTSVWNKLSQKRKMHMQRNTHYNMFKPPRSVDPNAPRTESFRNSTGTVLSEPVFVPVPPVSFYRYRYQLTYSFVPSAVRNRGKGSSGDGDGRCVARAAAARATAVRAVAATAVARDVPVASLESRPRCGP